MLTFDDGPEPGPTARVLDALKRECMRASFFVLGRSASRIRRWCVASCRKGTRSPTTRSDIRCSIGCRSQRAEAEIDHGFAAVDTALYGKAERQPVTPFFRFPGFASSSALLQRLERRHIAVFGADLWASDWHADDARPATSACARPSCCNARRNCAVS